MESEHADDLSSAKTSVTADLPSGRLNILVVDDRPQQLLVLESILADLKQNIILANSGREALRFLLANDCALILLDVNMPELDGFETAALIRARPKSKQIPIIFVTAYDETETHLSQGYSLGAVDYIHTPIRPEILLAKASVFIQLAQQTEQIRQEAERLENRVQVRTAELQSLNQALQAEITERELVAKDRTRLLNDARDGVRRRDEFLAMLAHELRNPLASIVTGAELMKVLAMSGPDCHQARDIIERQARHMSRLLRDLLDVSRITRGKISLQLEPLDIVKAVHEAIGARLTDPAMKNYEVQVSLPEQELYANADATRMQQILWNLLSNAAKYTPPGGRIEISLVRDRDRLAICVRDTGIGIPAEKLSEIFEPFVQLRQGDLHLSEGLGIGLTLVQRLVELHGGTVAAHSEGRNLGSEFRILLPVLDRSLHSDSPSENGQTSSRLSRQVAMNVVVVDDNEDIRMSLAAILRREGHRVQTAGDGEQGLELIYTQWPEVALVDIGMPGLDGYEVARRVRSHADGHRVRMVAVTGFGHPEDRQRALEAGFDEHLVKPVRREELLKLFAEASSKRPQTHDAVS